MNAFIESSRTPGSSRGLVVRLLSSSPSSPRSWRPCSSFRVGPGAKALSAGAGMEVIGGVKLLPRRGTPGHSCSAAGSSAGPDRLDDWPAAFPNLSAVSCPSRAPSP